MTALTLFGLTAGTTGLLLNTCKTASIINEASQPLAASIIVGATAGICAGLTLSALRWLRAVTLTQHDRSALIYLGPREYFQDRQINIIELANRPLYPDNQRRYELQNRLYTNNDPRDIIGFITGNPRFLENPPHNGKAGYYIYVVINWHYADQFKQWAKRGFAAQISNLSTSGGKPEDIPQDDLHLVISPSGRDPSNESEILDICDGPRYSFQWQPYNKWEFNTDDLKHRTCSWQSKFLIGIGRLIKWRKAKQPKTPR